jgi:DNA-binding LacI/PurR family transcriptional regulator
MAQSDEKKRATREKVRAYRERMRKRGLRPIQIWVPDVRAEGFSAEAHRQSAAVAMSPREAEDQAWIDSVSDWGDE